MKRSKTYCFNEAFKRNRIGARLCVQSISRNTLKGSAASGIFQQAGFVKLLRLVYDTAPLRGQCANAPGGTGAGLKQLTPRRVQVKTSVKQPS
jgi:hypothetical protein